MVGVVLIVIALLLVLPFTFFAIATAISVITSWSMTRYGEEAHEGSELIDLNV